MTLFHIRDLISVPSDDFLTEYPKRFEIEFDDGEILSVSRKRTYVSSFFWRIFKDFSDVEIRSDCHVDKLLGTKKLTAGTHREIGSNIFKAIIRKYMFVQATERETIQHHLQEATNDLYIGLRENSGRHLQTIDHRDCIALMLHPEIVEAIDNVRETPKGVEAVYDVIKKVIDTDKSLANNGMVRAVRSGAVKFNQVCQSIGIRGFSKEVNGRIYRTLSKSNYLFGMLNLFEFAADSCSSAEHLAATESPLQDSEYFSRRLQLLSCVVERIDPSDCGTTKTIPYFVQGPGYNEATGEYRKSSLRFLKGKIYIDPATGKQVVLEGDEKYLENTVIQVRSVLTCQHPDPHSVCQFCFGTLANNHSRYYNLGVSSATTVVSKISQKTLGTKHHISSGQGSGIVFNDELRQYFRRGPKNTDFVLQPDVISWSPKLVVTRDSSLGLVDILNFDNIDDINTERITGFEKVKFLVKSPITGLNDSDDPKLSQDKRLASMSLDLLKYVQEHGYITDERNNFVIDLSHWDVDKVIFTLPDIQVSFSAQGNRIAELVESKLENLAERSTEDAPLRVLNELIDMVTPNMDVNIAPLECLIYGMQQAGIGNFAMGRLSETPILGIGKQLIWQRSLGSALPYQEWNNLFLDPRTYDVNKSSPSVMMDVAVAPKEYLTHHSKTYVNGNYQRALRGEPLIN